MISHRRPEISTCLFACAAVCLSAGALQSGVQPCPPMFFDGFAPASGLWSNTVGHWTSVGGNYFPQEPDNSPITYTDLPFELRNFAVTVRVNNFSDGGIWLRTDGTSNNGVLLVTGGGGYGQGVRGGTAGRTLYFHVVTNGSYSANLGQTGNLFVPLSTHTIQVVVSGDTYTVYADGALTPVTQITTSAFFSGRVGLYGDQPNIPSGGSGPVQSFSEFRLAADAPLVISGPVAQSLCAGSGAMFTARVAGLNLSHRWQIEVEGGGFVNLTDGPLPAGAGFAGSATGSGTPTLNLMAATGTGGRVSVVRCVVSDGCASVTTDPASALVCATDFNCDGLTEPGDLDEFITAFFSDIESERNTCDYNGDGFVEPGDLDEFITAFFEGCA